MSGTIPGSARRRAVVEGSMWSVGAILVVALVVFVNYFGMKYYSRYDWTGSKLYSLSEKSESVLRGLDRDVTVTVFLQPGSNLHGPTEELLERYAGVSSRIRLRFVDPEKNLVEAQRLVDRYQVSALNVVVFESGDERRVVDTTSLADWDYSGMQYGAEPTMTAFKGEEAFTGAILELAEGRKPKVLFTSGHGERPLDGTGNDGLSRIGDLLGQENLALESWSSLGQGRVPEGTDLLVIAGPRVAFLPPELALFDHYLDAGGRMLVLLDPVLDDRGGLVDTGLEAWLAGRGVTVGKNLVVDPSAALPFYGAETIYAQSVGAHPIVESLGQAQYPVIVGLARSVGPGTAPEGFEARTLLETTSEGWGESDLVHLDAVARGDDDLPGPVPLAVAVAERPGGESEGPEEAEGEESAAVEPVAEPAGWRLVAIGDSDLATNGQLAAVGNPTLVANAFNWLLERQKLLGIGAKKPEQVRLSLTPGQLSAITWTVLAGLPGLAILAGVAVWSRRRR
ncbi:MAG TPA: GldG family protein [Thermoanaerobaculia bacterium]|nr:GldG family protein [Thermoanaerobaculia bacterium]